MRRKSAAALNDAWTCAPFFTDRSAAGRYDQLNLRLRRALSWLGRAEKEDDEDCDAAFLLRWIAFNAMYGSPPVPGAEHDEKGSFEAYLKKVSRHESEWISDVMRDLSTDVEKLLGNKYVFEPFWRHYVWKHRGNWEQQFKECKKERKSAVGHTKAVITLCQTFGRLYTLRNQLLHGGATWSSSVNRHQVTTGAKLMTALVPHFIDVMIRHPDGWGAPRYPVVRESGPQSGWTAGA